VVLRLWMRDRQLSVDPAAPSARKTYRPIPNEAIVVDLNGENTGGVIVFADDGYLSSLEIFWYDEPISPFPRSTGYSCSRDIPDHSGRRRSLCPGAWSCSSQQGVAFVVGCHLALETPYSCHSPARPFSWCVPRSSNSIPEPATRSLTVRETRTSPGAAFAATRAPVLIATPVGLSPTSSHSPVCNPLRSSIPSVRTALR